MLHFSFSTTELEIFLLLFARVTGFIATAPFYGMSNTPNRIKIGLGFFVSVLLYYMTLPHTPVSYTTLLGYAAIVLKETVVGVLIGLGANLCMMIVNFAGSLIDMEIGLAMMQEYDPTTRQQMSLSSVYYQYMILLLLLVSGMHRYILRALMETYELIPIDGAVFRMNRLLESMIAFMGQYLTIGFRICLPVFVATMMLNAILGILAKVAPQMNMFAVGIQLKLLLGLIVMFLTVGMLPGAADLIYDATRRMIVSMVEGLM